MSSTTNTTSCPFFFGKPSLSAIGSDGLGPISERDSDVEREKMNSHDYIGSKYVLKSSDSSVFPRVTFSKGTRNFGFYYDCNYNYFLSCFDMFKSLEASIEDYCTNIAQVSADISGSLHDYFIGNLILFESYAINIDFARSKFLICDRAAFDIENNLAENNNKPLSMNIPGSTKRFFADSGVFKIENRKYTFKLKLVLPKELTLKSTETPPIFHFGDNIVLYRNDIKEKIEKISVPGTFFPRVCIPVHVQNTDKEHIL